MSLAISVPSPYQYHCVKFKGKKRQIRDSAAINMTEQSEWTLNKLYTHKYFIRSRSVRLI